MVRRDEEITVDIPITHQSGTHRVGPHRGRQIRPALVAGLLALTAGAAACGSDTAGSAEVASLTTDLSTDGTATPDTATDDTATDGTSPTDPGDAMLAFAQCMREHGVDMPDPQVSGDGQGVIVIAGSAGGDDGTPGTGPVGIDPDFEAAQEACQPLMDAVISDVEIDPEVLAEQREQMLDFAQCMREHGVDMPDPVFDDNGGVSIEVGDPGDASGPKPGDDDWQAANDACSEILALPGGPGMPISSSEGSSSVGVVVGGDTDAGDGGEG